MHTKRKSPQIRSTTVLCVRRDNKVVLAADGQVTLGEGVIKHNAKKVRRLYNDKILAGFAGSTADALSLFARFENKLQEFHGNLPRAAVELSKDWRTDRYLRRLEAMLIVADKSTGFTLSGSGDVLEPEEDEFGSATAIGSGGNYALAAARALMPMPLEADEIVRRSMRIAGEICVYTNFNLIVESL